MSEAMLLDGCPPSTPGAPMQPRHIDVSSRGSCRPGRVPYHVPCHVGATSMARGEQQTADPITTRCPPTRSGQPTLHAPCAIFHVPMSHVPCPISHFPFPISQTPCTPACSLHLTCPMATRIRVTQLRGQMLIQTIKSHQPPTGLLSVCATRPSL